MQCLRDGDLPEGRERLADLIADDPDGQIAAYQQLGQSFLDTGENDQARSILRTGIEKARRFGDQHAAAEMSGLIDYL
jgi:hypothetical protein